MKKRLIAILLAVCTLVSMLAGLLVSASAENDISGDKLSGYVVGYTMASGDTVGAICTKLGVSFQQEQAKISKINNIADYSKMSIGTVVWIPVADKKEADTYYTLKTHTLAVGDDLATLCAKYGISTGDVLLNRLNTNLTNLTAGSTVTIPVYTGSGNGLGSGTATASTGAVSNLSGTVNGVTANATVVNANGTSTGTTGATATTISATTGSTTASTSTKLGNGDTLAYYLIPYTMQAGDTVAAVCATLGISFNANQALITRVNNITSYSRVNAGRTIYLPSSTAGSGTCYAVYAHVLQAGEYIYRLCQDYGISYASSQTMLKALNNTSYLENVKAGSTFYLPIAGSYASSGTSTGTGTSGTTKVTAYTITKDAATNGSFALKTSGYEISSAAEGTQVSVACKGNTGYVASNITVYKTGSSSTTVYVSNGTFTMPAYPVSVKVTFTKATAKNVTKGSVYVGDTVDSAAGSYTLKENGSVISNQAYSGSTVSVDVTAKTGYTLDEIVVFKTGDESTKVAVNNNAFTMPNYDVTVMVYLKVNSDYYYELSGSSTGNGTINFTVDDVVVSKAKAGETVVIAATPKSGYKLDSVTVKYTDEQGFAKEQVLNGTSISFKMPTLKKGTTLTCAASFVSSQYRYITCNQAVLQGTTTKVSLWAQVKNEWLTYSEVGRTVVILPWTDEHDLKAYNVYDAKGNIVNSAVNAQVVNGVGTFVMPDYNVTVKDATVIPAATSLTVSCGTPAAEATVKATVNASKKQINPSNPATAMPGENVLIETEAQTGYDIISGSVSYKSPDGNTYSITTSNGSFTMPRGPVTVKLTTKAKYGSSNTVTLVDTKGNSITNSGIAWLEVNGNKVEAGNISAGKTVEVVINSASGYSLKNIVVTYKDANGITRTLTPGSDNTFTMPSVQSGTGVTVKLTFETQGYSVTAVNQDTDKGTFTVEKNSSPIAYANQGEKVTLNINSYSGYTVESAWYTDAFGNKLDTIDLSTNPAYFTMPAKDVKVYVTFTSNQKTMTVMNDSANGTITASVGANAYSASTTAVSAKVYVGEQVYLSTVTNNGFILDKIVVQKAGDSTVKMVVSGNAFEMPAYDVQVIAYYRAVAKGQAVTLNPSTDIPEGCSVSFKVNGTAVNQANEGDTVTVNTNLTGGYIVDSIVVKTTVDDVPVTVVSGNQFTMPSNPVTVLVTFKIP